MSETLKYHAIVVGYQQESQFHVMHMVLYENQPTHYDFLILQHELSCDLDFEMMIKTDQIIEYYSATILDDKIFKGQKLG